MFFYSKLLYYFYAVFTIKIIAKTLILRQIVYIFIASLSFYACTDNQMYRVEGQLSNLDNFTLYVVYESPGGNAIDTVECDGKGAFSVSHEAVSNLRTITFYYNNRGQWFTVYPDIGKTVRVKGDAHYPQLIQIKGSRIHNTLSKFQKKAQALLKAQADLSSKKEENALTHGEEILKKDNLKFELRQIAQDFIAKHPKEEASAILMNEYFSDPGVISLAEEMLERLSPELNEYYLVKDLHQYIAKTKKTAEGSIAPDFRVVNIHGKTITPVTFRDKYYILAFTALWNDMCHTNEMMLDDLATKYPKDSLDILLISLDDNPKDMRELLKSDSIAWNLVTDSVGQSIRLFEQYNVNSAPKCFLIDKNGIILLNTTNGSELIQKVEEIME